MTIKAVLTGRRRHLAVLVTLSVVSNLLVLVGPIFMLQVYDRVLGSRSIPTLVALTTLMVSLFAFSALVDVLRSRMQVRFATLIHISMSSQVFSSAVHAGSKGNQSDPVRDLDTLRTFASGSAATALMDLPWLPLYMSLIYGLHPLLGWVAMGGAAMMVVLLAVNEFCSARLNQKVSAAALSRQDRLEDARANYDAVRSMGMMEAVSSRWTIVADQLAQLQLRSADTAGVFAACGKALRAILQSTVLAVGAYLVIAGQLSPGLMLAASVITARALAPIEQVVGHWRGFVSARQSLSRLRKIPEARPNVAMSLPLPRQRVSILGLSSGPVPHGAALIHDISFSLVAGEALGIIGLSGSGKTSVAKAVMGLWPKLHGEIRLDGSEIERYPSEALGRITGYLPQDVELFDGSVADNICRFQSQADPKSILEASQLAGTHDLILRLGEGYDTRIGPRGLVLSGGQRQRIGLARALFGNPFLLVLDEPTASLDSEGENALSSAVQAAKEREAIVIVVAHRPGTVANVDKILFMQAGRQAAFGPRDEVLAAITRRQVQGAERQHAHA